MKSLVGFRGGREFESDDGRFIGDVVDGDVVDVEGGFVAVGWDDDFGFEFGICVEEDCFFGEGLEGVEIDAGLGEAAGVVEVEVIGGLDYFDISVGSEIGYDLTVEGGFDFFVPGAGFGEEVYCFLWEGAIALGADVKEVVGILAEAAVDGFG